MCLLILIFYLNTIVIFRWCKILENEMEVHGRVAIGIGVRKKFPSKDMHNKNFFYFYKLCTTRYWKATTTKR